MLSYRKAAWIAVVIALAPQVAPAQPLGKIVVTPYAGVYAPTNTLAERSASGRGASIAASAEHSTGFALGATGAYWFAPRLSIEVGALYAWSDIRTSFATNDQGELDSFGESENAGVILGTTKLMIALFPATSEFQLRLGVGPAVITRVGSAYKWDADGKMIGRTDFGGAVSLCTKIPIGSSVALRLRAEDYMYQAKLGYRDRLHPPDNVNFDTRFQHDVVLSAGLQIGLMR